jgi:hypothetical protein
MDAIEEIVRTLESPKASARYDARDSLRVARSPDDATIAALERASSDSDVRDAARRTLNVHHTELRQPETERSSTAVVTKSDNRNTLAIIGLVTGLLSLIAWLLPICGAPVAIAAVVPCSLSRQSCLHRMAARADTPSAGDPHHCGNPKDRLRGEI